MECIAIQKEQLAERFRDGVRQTLMRLPDRPRSWLVRGLPGSLIGEVMRCGSIRDPEYFERFYADTEDPFGFDRNDYEQRKFSRLLELCGEQEFGRGLELGCALGAFTELLAPRCRELLAVDISAVAVKAAGERLSGFPGVRCEVRNLPSDLPTGKFDLIVASDILYYWTRADIRSAVRWFDQSLNPGGVLLAAHYVPFMGALLVGDEAHDTLKETTTLRPALAELVEFGSGRPYRVDRYEKSSGPSVGTVQRPA